MYGIPVAQRIQRVGVARAGGTPANIDPAYGTSGRDDCGTSRHCSLILGLTDEEICYFSNRKRLHFLTPISHKLQRGYDLFRQARPFPNHRRQALLLSVPQFGIPAHLVC
ncbi:hypothetical protein SDC9_52904 [bioreactor metagenome]|uniref:Uncharacterized protein n=1 Tax=bioreactor metagenome TaxID=1076179 RepID=A0A644WS74_9ZZZZ